MLEPSTEKMAEIEHRAYNIYDIISVICDYCKYNQDYEKVGEIHILALQLKEECTKLTNQF